MPGGDSSHLRMAYHLIAIFIMVKSVVIIFLMIGMMFVLPSHSMWIAVAIPVFYLT
jgi:hypothetical protein